MGNGLLISRQLAFPQAPLYILDRSDFPAPVDNHSFLQGLTVTSELKCWPTCAPYGIGSSAARDHPVRAAFTRALEG